MAYSLASVVLRSSSGATALLAELNERKHRHLRVTQVALNLPIVVVVARIVNFAATSGSRGKDLHPARPLEKSTRAGYPARSLSLLHGSGRPQPTNPGPRPD